MSLFLTFPSPLKSQDNIDVYIYITPFISQADGIYDNPAELLDVKLEFSDDEGLNNSKNEGKVTF